MSRKAVHYWKTNLWKTGQFLDRGRKLKHASAPPGHHGVDDCGLAAAQGRRPPPLQACVGEAVRCDVRG